MTPETIASMCELDSRCNDGIQVKLLWCRDSGRPWVTVVDTRSRDAFCVEVDDNERPLDVFHHPFAYAAQRGIVTVPPILGESALASLD
jgi:hypothetical protein